MGRCQRQEPDFDHPAPAHRVIGSSGKLTGYAGGLAAKETLLRKPEGRRIEQSS